MGSIFNWNIWSGDGMIARADIMIRIKICGITRTEDALACEAAGADALGFMFYEPSKRHVTFEAAARIIRAMPPLVSKVGVFVNAPADFVSEAIEVAGIDTLQFHGDESPEFCAQFHRPFIKAFRVKDRDSLDAARAYENCAWLLDSYVPGEHGGTGARFNWDLAGELVATGRPVILAGGLNPENAAEAVRSVNPYALDVSSGVELAPGIKDSAKVAAFIAAAKSA